MGVPAFFRWLSRKYASIVMSCMEEKPKMIDGETIPVDTSQPNPNDVEFDNLYLDMNGIIHPCCHPEDKPAPKNEDEMMVLIFEYIDRLFSIIRPRKVLYMAIDGVAPRAKMNQQRSRRFRAAKEAREKRDDVTRIKEELRAKGHDVPPDKPASEHFDSNCITPGTPFMFRLAKCLRFYIHDRLNNDPGWRNVKVILSDANVPGEGEHKIMDYIRRQRAQPDHDPNTHHCLCGADADLIMLGLATHEPYFTIIREEFKPNQPKTCEICAQLGHEMTECQGLPKKKEGEFDEISAPFCEEQQFIFLRLNILREYLTKELDMPNLPFKQDIERAIDDWVFMCFFVGNDFLPHLPSLEIREGAIDRLVNLYKIAVYKTEGYLTDSGKVHLDRVQLVLSDLGELEDEIFKKRRQTDLDFKRRDKEKKKRARRFDSCNAPKFMMGGQYAPQAPSGAGAISNPRQTAADGRNQAMNESANRDAAASLRAMLNTGENSGQKRKIEEVGEEEDAEPPDEVKLWEDGFKDRYYQSKFAVGTDDLKFRYTVANEYVLGLCWVLLYYYQGCPSWKWYFPYHYAPFASDFLTIADVDTTFEKTTKPFRPMEQLMSVFPAGSKQFLPLTWQDLMDNCDSNIIDFYPEDFSIDLNGKKFAWQGVALLPFVDEKRLQKMLATVYPDLTPYEVSRNVRGDDRLFVGRHHPSYDFLVGLYEGTHVEAPGVDVNPSLTQGVKATVWCDPDAVMSGQLLESPIPDVPSVPDNSAIVVKFLDPQFDPDYIHPAVILKGARMPAPVLKPEDFNRSNRGGRGGRGGWRPQLGFTPGSGYRGRDQYNPQVANRMIRGSTAGQGHYGQVPPVPGLMGSSRSYNQGGGRDDGGHNRSQGGHQRSSESWQRNQQSSQPRQYDRGGYNPSGGYNRGGQNRGGHNSGSYNPGGFNRGGGGGGGGGNRGGYNQRSNYGQQQSSYHQSHHSGGSYGDRSNSGGSQASGRSHPGYGMVQESNDQSQGRRLYPPPQARRY